MFKVFQTIQSFFNKPAQINIDDLPTNFQCRYAKNPEKIRTLTHVTRVDQESILAYEIESKRVKKFKIKSLIL